MQAEGDMWKPNRVLVATVFWVLVLSVAASAVAQTGVEAIGVVDRSRGYAAEFAAVEGPAAVRLNPVDLQFVRRVIVLAKDPLKPGWIPLYEGPAREVIQVRYEGTPISVELFWTGTLPDGRGTITWEKKLNVQEGTQRWQYHLGPSYLTGGVHPAMGPDGTIYVTGSGMTATWKSKLAALTQAGSVKWVQDLPGGWASSPVVTPDGVVCVAVGKDILAFDPAGVKKWQYNAVYAVGRLAVGADGTIYTYHVEAGAYQRQTLAISSGGGPKWSTIMRLDNQYFVGESIAVTNQAVVVVGRNLAGGPGRVFFLDPARGGVTSTVSFTGQVTAGVATGADGTVYLPTVGPNQLVGVRADGSMVWRRDMTGPIGIPTLGADGSIYVVQFNRGLLGLAGDGSLRWAAADAPGAHASAVAADGTIYFGGGYSGPAWAPFVAVRPDGSVKWRLNIPTGAGSPLIGPDGVIYVAGGEHITAVWGSSAPGSTPWPRGLGGSTNASRVGR
jgi:hypothetical protein